MRQFLSSAVVILLMVEISYANPTTNIRSSSLRNTNVPASAVVTKNAANLSEASVTSLKTLSSKTDNDSTDKNPVLTASATERVGALKKIQSNPKTYNTNNTNKTSSGSMNDVESETLRTQIESMQAQIYYLQNELARKAGVEELNHVQRELKNKAETKDISELNTTFTNKLEKYAILENVDKKIEKAKNETTNQIASLDTKISNVADGQIDETALKGHFDKFLDSELGATNNNKFARFAKTSDLTKEKLGFTTKDDIAADLSDETNGVLGKKFKGLDAKFAAKDDVLEATNRIGALDSRVDNIASSQIDETALKGHFDKFLDSELGATNNNKFARFAKTSDITKEKLGFVTANDVNTTISSKGFVTADRLGETISDKKILDGFAKTSDLTKEKLGFTTKDDIAADLSDETNGVLGKKFKGLDAKFAAKDDLAADKLATTLSGKFAKTDDIPTKTAIQSHFGEFLDTELGKTDNNKFAGFTKNTELNNKIATLDNFKALDNKFAAKEEITGLAKESDLPNKFNAFLGDELAKTDNNKFAEFTKNTELNAKIATLDNFKALDNKFAGKDELDADKLATTLSGKFATKAAILEATDRIGALDSRVDNIADGQIDETTIERHFNNFLDTELVKADNNKFARFAKTDDINADNLAETLKNKFEGKGTVSAAFDTTNSESILSKALSDTSKGLGKKFKDVNDTVESHDTALNNLDNTIEGKITSKGLLTGKQLKDAISGDDTTSELAGALNTKFNKFAKTDELNDKIANLDNFKSLGTRLGTAESNIAENTNKFADYTTTTGLGSVISGKIKTDLSDSNSELAKKFGDYATTNDLNDVDSKFADYTKTTGLGSVISNRIKTDLSDSNSELAKKFGNYTDNNSLNAKIANLDNFKALDNKFAAKDDLDADKLATKLSNKFATSNDIETVVSGKGFVTASDVNTTISDKGFLTENTLADAISSKEILKDYATSEEVNTAKTAAIETAAADATTKADNAKTAAVSEAASSVDTKLSDYTTTTDLGSVISGKIKTDLSDSNSELAKKFGDYATTNDLNDVDSKFANYATSSDLTTATDNVLEAAKADATSKADAAKTVAIETAAADATTKADNAKTAAVSAAANDASSKYATTGTVSTLQKTLLGDDDNIGLIEGLRTDLQNAATELTKNDSFSDNTVLNNLKAKKFEYSANLNQLIQIRPPRDLEPIDLSQITPEAEEGSGREPVDNPDFPWLNP